MIDASKTKSYTDTAGGIGGLLGRSHAYQSGSGGWTNHNVYQADGNGNVTYMLNSSQSKVAEYRYDPFGNTISSSGTLAAANVYRFSSKELHVNSGLYYYTHRFYSPNLQRWLNQDPIDDVGFRIRFYRKLVRPTPNLYFFVGNNPNLYVDPQGLSGTITIPFPWPDVIVPPWAGPVAAGACGGIIGWKAGTWINDNTCVGENGDIIGNWICPKRFFVPITCVLLGSLSDDAYKCTYWCATGPGAKGYFVERAPGPLGCVDTITQVVPK